jgi:hypothetical protein
MSFAFLLLGVYLLAVAWHGNTQAFLEQGKADVSSAGRWLVAAIVVIALAKFSPTKVRPVFHAFMVLAIVGFVVVNWQRMSTNTKQLYNSL